MVNISIIVNIYFYLYLYFYFDFIWTSVLVLTIHDDVIKWNIIRVTGPLCGEFTGHRTRDAELWFVSLICARIDGWATNRKAGDSKRHRAHYDVTVLLSTNCRIDTNVNRFVLWRRSHTKYLHCTGRIIIWSRQVSMARGRCFEVIIACQLSKTCAPFLPQIT